MSPSALAAPSARLLIPGPVTPGHRTAGRLDPDATCARTRAPAGRIAGRPSPGHPERSRPRALRVASRPPGCAGRCLGVLGEAGELALDVPVPAEAADRSLPAAAHRL